MGGDMKVTAFVTSTHNSPARHKTMNAQRKSSVQISNDDRKEKKTTSPEPSKQLMKSTYLNHTTKKGSRGIKKFTTS